MRKIVRFLGIMICCVMLTSNIVLAGEADVPPNLTLDEEVNKSAVAKKVQVPSSLVQTQSSGSAITCHASLKVYNNYTYVWAYSYVENGYMDYIRTVCSAAFKSGSSAGYVDSALNVGQVQAHSAIIQVDTSVFSNLQVYSAESLHCFKRDGYKTVNLGCSWSR